MKKLSLKSLNLGKDDLLNRKERPSSVVMKKGDVLFFVMRELIS